MGNNRKFIYNYTITFLNKFLKGFIHAPKSIKGQDTRNGFFPTPVPTKRGTKFHDLPPQIVTM